MANQKYKIELTAIDKTKSAFGKVKAGLSGVKNAAGGVTRAIGGASLAFGAAAVAIGVITKKSYEYIDALGKTSLRTGIAVENLQAYTIAAQESGASTEEATKGFEKFARSIGDAERGLKTQLDIFQGLGVRLRDVDGQMRSTEDILKDTADGIMRLGSEAEKATVLANLFGRAGLRFSEIFRAGSAGLDAFTAKARSLGIVMDSQIVENVQQFNDSFNILTNQFNSMKNNVLGAFAPVLNEVVEDLSDLMGIIDDGDDKVEDLGKEFKDLGESIAKNIISGIAETVRSTGELIKGVQNFSRETEIAINNLKLLIDPTLFEFISAALSRNSAELGILFGTMYGGVDATQRLKNRNKELEEQISNSTNTLENAALAVENYGKNIGKTIVSSISLTGFVNETNNALDDQANKLINIAEPLDVYRAELEKTDKLVDQNIVSAFKKAEDSLVSFVQTGKLNFKDLVNSIIADLIRLAIRQQIIAPLFNMLYPGATKPFTGNINMGAMDFKKTGGGYKDPSDFEGGGFTGFGARAGGLDNRGGFPAILHPNETIIDHTKGQQMVQQPVNVNFSIQATDAAGIDELLVSRKNQIVAMVSQAMNQKGKVGLI
jgi:hypothetical protein